MRHFDEHNYCPGCGGLISGRAGIGWVVMHAYACPLVGTDMATWPALQHQAAS